MKNKKSIYIIVSISVFTALLHFVTGSGYQGVFSYFIHGYLIDIVLPFNLYLLLQISLRKYMTVNKARITGAIFTFALGTITEILQLHEVEFLGRTYDPWDILMYVIGIVSGIAIDLIIIEKLEMQSLKNK